MTSPVIGSFGDLDQSWFGMDDDSQARALASTSLPYRRVEAAGVPPSTAAAVRLMRVVRDPEYSALEVVRMVESDPGLAARVLRMANSAMLGLRRPCRDVSHAVALLGGRAMSEIAAAAAVCDLYRPHGLEGRLRAHAVATAAIAREIALQRNLPTEDLLIIGLLHDIGKLMLLQGTAGERFGPSAMAYAEHLGRRVAVHGGCHLDEREALGYDHAVLASVMIGAWGIPEPIPQVVGMHHRVERAVLLGGRLAQQVCLLCLADRLAHTFDSPILVDSAAQAVMSEHAAVAFLELDLDDLLMMLPELQYAHFSSADLLA